jgi:hypothetical protein
MNAPSLVGPVLDNSALAGAMAAAIRSRYGDAQVLDRGSYRRVLVPGRCELTRESVEREAGSPVQLRAALERVMMSFQGRFTVTDDAAVWEAPG